MSGVAVLCEVLTDNRNRTAPEIRKIFELSDGKLGGTGCVAWMFDSKGLFLIPTDRVDEDRLMEIALEAVTARPAGRQELLAYLRPGHLPGRRPGALPTPASRPKSKRSRGFPRTPSIWTPTPPE